MKKDFVHSRRNNCSQQREYLLIKPIHEKMKDNSNLIKTNVSPEEFDMVLMSFDFIRYNRNMTNDRLPDLFIKFWSIPDFSIDTTYKSNDSQVLVFMFILDLNFNSHQETEQILNSFQFSLLFYRFQVILATTAYSRANQIPLQPFKIFDVAGYTLPQLDNPGYLLSEYERIIKPVTGKKRKFL